MGCGDSNVFNNVEIGENVMAEIQLIRELINYGALGIFSGLMAWYIMYTKKDHRKERKEWQKTFEKLNNSMVKAFNKNTKVMEKHNNVVSDLKGILQTGKNKK